ncbi:hypothetical protein [Roseovarius nubinhibens]|uniref:hypothetical protein n=1 Tax=Roseovarius nubinhibens TaxID=314263 RepID=UPI0030ED7F19|tara:strand:- start:23824 stop:24186 length:363 start_codon:yes stop_codon:yes gene_type:complete
MSARRGTVSFEAGGVSYTARLSINAMCDYQDMAGETVIDAFAVLEAGKVDIKRMRNLMLVSIEGDLDVEEVGEIMSEMGFEEVGSVLGKLGNAAFPNAAGGTSGNGKAGNKARKAKPDET